jgi:hypothetical protein
MTITVGTDTYATLAEADAYAALRSWTDWSALSDAAKELRLTEAAVYLDTSYAWKGAITSTTQAMSWPRTGVTDREGRTIESDAYPSRLKDAQVELARLASTTALVTNDAQGEVKSIQAGSVGITFKDAQNVSEAAKYRSIDRLLTGLYLSRAGLVRNVRLSKA